MVIMARRLILTIISLIVLGIAIVILFLKTTIDMADFFTQLAVGLTLLLPIIGYWGFKPYIDRFLEKRKNSLDSNKLIEESNEINLGHPIFENNIYHYKSREELPKFSDLTNYATESVDICALTSTLMILQHSDVIKKSIRKGIKFTFLLFDKHSEHLDTYKKILENSEDLENQITTSMKRLCKMKKQLGSSNIIIKTYNSFEKIGTIIVDKNNDRAIIKIEEYNMSNPNMRRNEIVFKRDNPDYYQSCLDNYNNLLEKSNNYNC